MFSGLFEQITQCFVISKKKTVKKKHTDVHSHIIFTFKNHISLKKDVQTKIIFLTRPSELMIWDEAGVHVIPQGPGRRRSPPGCVRKDSEMDSWCVNLTLQIGGGSPHFDPETETLRFMILNLVSTCPP